MIGLISSRSFLITIDSSNRSGVMAGPVSSKSSFLHTVPSSGSSSLNSSISCFTIAVDTGMLVNLSSSMQCILSPHSVAFSEGCRISPGSTGVAFSTVDTRTGLISGVSSSFILPDIEYGGVSVPCCSSFRSLSFAW